jgi:hypothetical protein
MTMTTATLRKAILLVPFTMTLAHAQGLQAVRPVPGYECMALNLSQQQMMTETVPILAQPSSGAQKIGIASATVIAAEAPPVDGYRKVLRLDGKPGWVSTQFLKPWVNPGGSGQKCVPSVMSNGRLGFGFS